MTTVDYNGGYIPQSEINNFITTEENAHAIKSSTGSGFTRGLLSVNEQALIQAILLVVPTKALVIDVPPKR